MIKSIQKGKAYFKFWRENCFQFLKYYDRHLIEKIQAAGYSPKVLKMVQWYGKIKVSCSNRREKVNGISREQENHEMRTD